MALSRFVLTSTVTVMAGEPGTGGAAAPRPRLVTRCPSQTFIEGTVIVVDSSAGSTGPQLLYQAIGAGNLRVYVQGQDDVGHAALAN
jgi:hypothetical protein